MKSRVHPTYKTKYRVGNWREYERALIQRGDVTLWLCADATTGITLIEAVDGDVAGVTADTAYDTIAFYDAAGARGATVMVPPATTATVSRRRPRSSARDHTITEVKALGRRQWKKASGYHRQARVENAFFRYKAIIGDGLRARSPAGQGTEAVLACTILNQMTERGRPASYGIGR
jgi:hypothetical protein